MIKQLDIGLVVDLRDAAETGVLISSWPAGQKTQFHNANVTLDLQLDGRPLINMMLEQNDPAAIEQIVARGFPLIAEFCGPALRFIVDFMINQSAPVLFHCINGRDRTGVISALLLYMLDMPKEAIIADFMLTNERIDVEKAITNTLHTYREVLGIDMTRAAIEPATLVRSSYIDTMLDGLESKYGAMDNFFNQFGIDAAMRQEFRDRALES